MPKITISHKQKMKAIRGYVNFDYDLRKPLSRAAKAKISRYYQLAEEFSGHTHYIYRPRSKKHLKAAHEFTATPKGFPNLKVAFVPTESDETPKITFTKKGKMRLTAGKGRNVEQDFIPLDPEAVIENPENAVLDAIAEYPGATYFTINCGLHEMRNSIKRPFIAREVARLAARYSEENGLSEKDNHYFGHWLNGLRVYNFKNQESAVAYMAAKSAAARKLQRTRRLDRQRQIREKRKGAPLRVYTRKK